MIIKIYSIIILIVGLLFIVNSYFVTKKDGKTLQHFLPFVFGCYFIAIFIFGSLYNRHFLIQIAFYLINLIPLIMVYIIVFSNMISNKNKNIYSDYIIVLGCRINEQGKPMRVLRNRLKIAIDEFNKCKNKPYIIVSGGKGGNEPISEASSMKEYLISNGIDSKYIIEENQSTSTYENLFYSKKIMDDRDQKHLVTVVSSRYHLLRASEIAKSLGIKAYYLGSKTTLLYYPSALCRETVAFVLNNILICILYFVFVISILVCGKII